MGTPKLTPTQEKLMKDLYFDQNFMWGRDKLFFYLRDNYPNSGISRRQIMEFLKKQNIHQLYRQTKLTTNIKPTIMKKPFKQIAIDLIDMQKYDDGFVYILTAIDLFSKKAWAEPLKNKEDTTVAKGMDKILTGIGHHVSSIRSDNGSEFIANEFKNVLEKHKTKQVLSDAGKPQSNGQIENFNKNIKTRLKMWITQHDSNDWVSVLQQFIDNYNNIRSRVTKKTPNQLAELVHSKKGKIQELFHQQELNQNVENIKKAVVSKNNAHDYEFKIGDDVRLKLKIKDNEKVESVNWSKEIYKIWKIHKPRTQFSKMAYNVEDDDTRYTDKLYANDLQLITAVENPIKDVQKYEISKIVEKRINKDKSVEYLIQWKGYRKASDRTWVSEADLQKDNPKYLKAFNKKEKITK